MPLDPSKLLIRIYPDPVLRQVAKPIPAVTDEVRAVARRMLEVMREERGIGLAAPQVGVSWRMFLCDVPPPPPKGSKERRPEDDEEEAAADPQHPSTTKGPVVYINPKLTQLTPPPPVESSEEGCLSLPEIRGQVLRPPAIAITYTDLEGQTRSETASGLLARCWQHENDHLDGVLIIDKFTQMSRLRTRLKVRQLERDAQ